MPVNVWIHANSARALSSRTEAILRAAIGDRPGRWSIFILDMSPSPGCVITVEGPDNFLFREKFKGADHENSELILDRISEALPPYARPRDAQALNRGDISDWALAHDPAVTRKVAGAGRVTNERVVKQQK